MLHRVLLLASSYLLIQSTSDCLGQNVADGCQRPKLVERMLLPTLAAELIVSHKEHVQPGRIVFLELVKVGLGLLGLTRMVILWLGKHIDGMCQHCRVQTVILKLT